ncbi:ferroxidase fet3, partial [Coemansia sp. RSA 1824]
TNNQFGTFWIHGHTRHQEADGFYTPLIIHSRKQPVIVYDEELLMTFEDWYTGEFYVRQAYIDSLNDARTLTPYYSKALINGYDGNKTAPITFVPGKRYRLRIICMSINNWFKFRIPGHRMTVIEADGVESMPLEVDGLSMGPGQRYSVIVTAHDLADFNYIYNVTSSLYKSVLVPTLYTALSMGELAKNSSVYGPQTNAYVLKHLEVVEIVINNPAIEDHTFHFHGHNVQVIETGPFGNSSTIDREPVPRILSGPWPMWRDTVQVRAFEFIRVRFRADNP